MPRYLILICLVTGLLSCVSTISISNFELEKNNNFPQWLSINSYATNQTSGIAYLGADESGNKNFLLADDIGKIHRMIMTGDRIKKLAPVFLSEKVKTYLEAFPKLDFEEIVYDKYTGKVYLSIEGNHPREKESAGIFQLQFAGDVVTSDTIINIKKLDIQPDSLFKKYLAPNISYEGLAVDEHYFYLGLEGFSEGYVFADSTLIFVVDKNNLQIIKEISTKGFGIHTICGLYSDKNFSLFGIDRNNKKLFNLHFDNSLNISDILIKDIVTSIPNYPSFDYVASLESVTMDDEKNVYIIDDPWKMFFIPSEEILNETDSSTINNFKNFVPVIFKYKLIN